MTQEVKTLAVQLWEPEFKSPGSQVMPSWPVSWELKKEGRHNWSSEAWRIVSLTQMGDCLLQWETFSQMLEAVGNDTYIFFCPLDAYAWIYTYKIMWMQSAHIYSTISFNTHRHTQCVLIKLSQKQNRFTSPILPQAYTSCMDWWGTLLDNATV